MKNAHTILKILVFGMLLAACEQADTSVSSNGTIGTPGSLARFAMVGNNLYTAETNSIKHFVWQNGNLVYMSTHQQNQNIETLFARDANTLFAGTTTGMLIFNIAQGTPNFVSLYSHVVSCDPVVANDSLAFVTLNTGFAGNTNNCNGGRNVLMTFDVRNLNQINQLGELNLAKPIGLALQDSILFLCNDGLEAYTFKNPASPVRIARLANVDAIDVIATPKALVVRKSDGFEQYKFENNTFTFLSAL